MWQITSPPGESDNAAFQEAHDAQAVAIIMKSVFNIRTLSAAAFIYNTGFMIKLRLENLDDRPPAEIGYLFPHCDIEPVV